MTTPTSGPISLYGNVGSEFRTGQPISISSLQSIINDNNGNSVGNNLGSMRGQTWRNNGQNCVALDSWFPDLRQGFEINIGDSLLALDYTTMNSTVYAIVQRYRVANESCLRITSESGITLVASLSTPVTLRDGSMIGIYDTFGRQLPVKDKNGFRWEYITGIEYVGKRDVAFIFAGHATFAAGEKPSGFIFTHNIKQ